jgi:hypothetical protein
MGWVAAVSVRSATGYVQVDLHEPPDGRPIGTWHVTAPTVEAAATRAVELMGGTAIEVTGRTDMRSGRAWVSGIAEGAVWTGGL